MPKKKSAKKQASSQSNQTPQQPKHPQIIQSELAVMRSIASKKAHVEQKMEHFVAMTAMLLLIFTNFLGAILLIPFLLFFESYAQYAIVAVFAIGFGLIFNFMIHSIEHLGDKHHIIAGIVVPFFAMMDIVILFSLLEKIVKKLAITVTYNYTFIVILFIVAFLIPYLIDVIRGKHKFQ
ncbi:MAG: hypothetical protein AABX98_06505 [Nanoarchaeota archaeon]